MQNLQTAPETATNSAETREPSQSELDQVAALLRGEEPGGNDQGDQGGDAGDSNDSEASSETSKAKGKPKNLADLAETLGIKVADLYALEIPFDNNGVAEHKTLGELKDAVAERSAFEVDKLAWEEAKTGRETQLARSMQELQEIIGMLPRSAISDKLVQAVTRKRAEVQEVESRMTRQVIPEWSDETVEERDRVAMRAHLSEYGFPTNYLDQLVDHKTLRYIRESMLRQKRIERALAQVKTVRKPGHTPSGAPTAKPKPTRRVRSSKSNDQAAKVAHLLING